MFCVGGCPKNRVPFAALNADETVMEFFPSVLQRDESDALIERIEEDFERWEFGLWALELRSDESFIGFTGLSVPRFEASFMPAVEVGWRLARSAWGKGFATEAAGAALTQGFQIHGLAEIVSFTYEGNLRSRAVMERLDMHHDPADDFHHPLLRGHRLARHVLYRMAASDWSGERGSLSSTV